METFNGVMYPLGELHKSVEKEWMVWRLVEEKGFSPNVLRNEWTRVDILKYNAILDMRASGEHCSTGYSKYRDKQEGR